ncbi:MAG: 2-C-methyl-D-erythritol 4-phosphate cytidylyltransferase [Ruminococcaceae bacterium]|nr:2-C-methyl-D-erythritol 4-phosphate cytidylyltransferase [Oscillospiraceae bacterium]
MCMLKKIAGVFRAISGSPHPKNFTSAVIAAAGSSVRFGGELTKQMTELCGAPIVVHTLLAHQKCDCIHEIIIVAKKEEVGEYERLCEEYGITKVSAVITGGFTRQDSVLKGLDAVSKKSKFIAISDAARCLITPHQIELVCRAAYKYSAATAAHNSTDTVKIADSKGFIESTADRKTVWLAQTPQVFKTKLYRAAAYTALKKGFDGTDDNMLVENINHPIRLVECGTQNIKITTRDDMVFAEALLKKREIERLEDEI